MAGENLILIRLNSSVSFYSKKLDFTPIKKTKTGYSTAADVLEKLESEHEIISHILHYRQLGKLNSTYIEGLMKEIHEDGKIHTRFQQAVTQQGRVELINPEFAEHPDTVGRGKQNSCSVYSI